MDVKDNPDQLDSLLPWADVLPDECKLPSEPTK